MVNRIELLVHAGAPSSRKDDDKYRAQAEAYLGFQGDRVDLSTNASGRPRRIASPTERASRIGYEDRNEINVAHENPTVFLDDTQLAYGALDSQLFTSSLIDEDVPASSRRLAQTEHKSQRVVKGISNVAEAQRHNEKTSQPPPPAPVDFSRKRASTEELQRRSDVRIIAERLSSSSQHSEIEFRAPRIAEGQSQSSYLKSPILDRAAKKRRLNDHANENDGSRFRQSAGAAYVPISEGGWVGLGYVGEQQVNSIEKGNSGNLDSVSGNDIISELPTSYSLSDITSDSSRAKVRSIISQRSVSDPGPRIESISPAVVRAAPASKECNAGADVDTLHRSGNAKDARKATTSVHQAIDVQRPPPPLQTGQPQQVAPNPQAMANNVTTEIQYLESPVTTVNPFKNLSTSIIPPEPPPGDSMFTTHVSDHLRHLAEDLLPEDRYKPITATREPRTHERGYWLVDCSVWPSKLQIDFWLFLEKTIGNGTVGWGIWCVRNDNEHESSVTNTGLGTVKIFCWGETIKHVYLLLYVASTSKVRRLGLQWIDAEGKVVVQMRKG